MQIRTYIHSDEPAVIHLWKLCGLIAPQNHPQLDIQRKLAHSPELFLVGTHNNEIVATVMAGYDGHRGWINCLAVAPHLQKTGYGRQLMNHAKTLPRELGCQKNQPSAALHLQSPRHRPVHDPSPQRPIHYRGINTRSPGFNA